MAASWKKVPSRFFLAIASIFFTLVLMELGLRLFRPINFLRPSPNSAVQETIHQRSSIRGLPYEMAPNREAVWQGELVKTNSYGMRDDARTQEKPRSVLRIAALGDSYTFGLGVPAEQAYPKVLERLLNESAANQHYRYEVLNFGVIGYCSRDEALVLKYKVLVWNPDVVILDYVLNDPETDPIEPTPSFFDVPWWRHFHLFRLIARGKYNWDVESVGGGDYYKYLHAEGGEKWKSVIRAFSEIKDMTFPRDIKVLVVIFPMIQGQSWEKSWAEYPYAGLHKQVADLARKNGFQVIDLLQSYSRYRPRDLVISPWDDHPTALGYRVAARAIEEKLLARRSFLLSRERQGVK